MSEALEQVKPERPKYTKHDVRIESQGRAMLTKVFVDGVELRGLMSLHIDINPATRREAWVTLTMSPRSLMFNGEQMVVEAEGVVK